MIDNRRVYLLLERVPPRQRSDLTRARERTRTKVSSVVDYVGKVVREKWKIVKTVRRDYAIRSIRDSTRFEKFRRPRGAQALCTRTRTHAHMHKHTHTTGV